MRAPSVALALALLAAPLAGCTSGEEAGDEPLEWRFTDTEGEVHSNGTAAGTPTVFFFMATWCPSCQALAEDTRTVHDDYADDGVDVLTLSWDPDEGEEDLEDWKDDHNQSWPHGVDPGLETARTFDVDEQSTVVILDADNVKAAHWDYGQASADEMSAILDDLLAS